MSSKSVHGGSSDHRLMIKHGYELGQNYIGEGQSANVYRATHRLTGRPVAVKILKDAGAGDVEREIRILRLLRHHPHIIRFYHAIFDAGKVCLVMELAESGELYYHVPPSHGLDEAEARRVFRQVVSAVAYCHRNMVVHHDLKLDNVLLDEDKNAKLADFGLSNFFGPDQVPAADGGSLQYAAPELLERATTARTRRGYLGPQVDVWSCGVILFAMLCGRLPFEGLVPRQVSHDIKRKMISGKLKIPSTLSIGSRELIWSMLQLNPDIRATIEDVRLHPWLQPSLPPYIALPPLHATAQTLKIDDETVVEVVQMFGFDKEKLLQSLHNRVENNATVAYHLILDKRFDAPTRYLWTRETAVDTVTAGTESGSSTVPERPKSKWTLGLEFHDCPRETMRHVREVLQAQGIRCIKDGYYKMICKSSSTDSLLLRSLSAVRFEIQLYKAGERNYMLDLTRISGPQLPYLSLCSDLVSKLRIL